MIRKINNSISNSLVGPISKPLVSGATHDIMGNSLGPTVTEVVIDTFSSTDVSSGLHLIAHTAPIATANSFALEGQNYTATAVSLLYVSVGGGQGNYTYILFTATNDSGGTGIRDVVVGEDIAQTMGIRITGGAGTEDFYPRTIDNLSNFDWKDGGNANAIILLLNVGSELDPWVGTGGVSFGHGMGFGKTGDLTLSLLT